MQHTNVTAYVYPAEILRVVDGDTVWVRLTLIDADLGFNAVMRQTHDVSLRLGGINAPETSTDAGKVARTFLEELTPSGTKCVVYTVKDKTEKYGRYLAWVYLEDGTCINDKMLETGHAIAYNPSGIKRPAPISLQ